MHALTRQNVRPWHLGLAAVPLAVGLLAGANPMLAIGAAAGIAFVAIVLSDLAIGVALFILLEYVMPDSGGGLFSTAKIAGLLLMFSWLAVMTTRRGTQQELASEHPGFVYLLLAFLGWVLMSALWAKEPADAAFAWVRYLQNAILLLIVYTAIRRREQLVWVLLTLAVGGAIAGGYGLLNPPADLEAEGRLGGTYGEPNELASYLVVGVIVAAALLALPRRSPAFRMTALVCAAISLAALFLTVSRAALVALAVAAAVAIVFGGRWRGRAIALASTVLVVAVSYFAVFAPAVAVERLTFTEGTGSGREDLWEIGMRMVETHPIQGVGAGNYRATSADFLLDKPGLIERDEYIVDKPNLVHNIYLGVFSELGIVGGLLFLGIIGFSLRCYLLSIRNFGSGEDRAIDLLARAALVATVALLAADFFASEQFSKQLWLLLALGPALLGISRRSARRLDPAAAPA